MPSQSVLQYLARQRRKVEPFVLDWKTPAGASATYILVSTGLTAAVQTIVTFAHQPDCARLLNIKGNASGINTHVYIYGKDIEGNSIMDDITANGSGTVIGAKCFLSVSKIVLPIRSHGSGDEISVGIAASLGLPFCLPENSVLQAVHNGAVDTYPTTIGKNTTDMSKNYVTFASAPGGDHNISLFGLVRK